MIKRLSQGIITESCLRVGGSSSDGVYLRTVCLKKAKRGIINRLLRAQLLFKSEVEGTIRGRTGRYLQLEKQR